MLSRAVDSGVGVGPQPRREGADRTAISNGVSSLFNFIAGMVLFLEGIPESMFHDDPHLAGQRVVAGVVNHGQTQLVDPWWVARGVPDVEEAACDRGFVNITEYTPGGGVLSQSHFDLIVLETGDVGRT